MRIAHVSDCYLPRLGGIELQVHDLAVRQRDAGHDVEVVTSVPGRSARVAGITVHRPPGDEADEAIRYARTWRGRDVVMNGGFDVVHVHASTFSPLAYLTAMSAGRAKVPTVITVHSMWDYLTPVARLADLALGWRRWPLVWSTVSTAAAVPLRRLLPVGTDIAVLPNGVDRSRWAVDPAVRDGDDVHIACVMRLASRKRAHPLARMLREAHSRLPDGVRLRATIVGDGPQRRSLERYLRRHDMVDWVDVPGRLGRPEIRDLFRRADVFVAPANLESFGIAALEARCAGLPVVAKAATGVRDFVTHGREGLLADTDAQMVDAIVHLATSPATRSAMASYNRSHPPPVTWDEVLDRCAALYRQARGVPAVPRPAVAGTRTETRRRAETTPV